MSSERFLQLAEGLDVAPLLAKLAEHPELWRERTERQNFPGSPHKDTETIYLRWARDQSLMGGLYDLTQEDHQRTINALAPAIFDVVNWALTAILVNPPRELDYVGRVIITKLGPGGAITPHVDEGPYADRYDRFHVGLAGVGRFTVGGKEFFTEPGKLYWFNHKLEHAVVNWGTHDRIHLIIDLEAPEYRAKRGLTFQRERPHELLDEARPLFEAHYKEIAHYQDIPLDIDEAAYLHMEEAGALRCYTARYNGELVGYCVFLVQQNKRYRSSLQALQDIFYVDKGRRGALIGKRLIEFTEAQLTAEGVQVIYHHAKVDSQAERFLGAMGYTAIDAVLGKRLDR